MKLLYIANSRIPTEKAHGIQIMKMCEAFSGLEVEGSKLEVELVAPKRLNWIKSDPFEYYGMAKTFKITKLPCLDLIFHKPIGHAGLWVESFTFFCSVLVYLFFKKTDIIYTRDKSLAPLSFLKNNIIFEAHTFPRKYFLYAPFIKRFKGIAAITKKLKDSFAERGIDPLKILIVPDGVDLNEFKIQISKIKIREQLGLPQDKKIVLYAGHLYEWKGANTLLEAARNLQFPISNLQFIFIGGTKEDIESFKVKAEGLKNVLIVGHRPHSEIPYWLKAADVLVLPNSGKEEISKHWTSPLKMFEYMASGNPIVASDLPSIREILNEQNAVLVESDDPQKIADGINLILQNPQLSDRISTKASLDVQEYSWAKRAKIICQKLF